MWCGGLGGLGVAGVGRGGLDVVVLVGVGGGCDGGCNGGSG